MIGAQGRDLTREHKLPHSLDRNACCEYCGFDAAEGHHQLVLITPDHLPVRTPDYARFCEERRKVMREVVGNEKARVRGGLSETKNLNQEKFDVHSTTA